MMQTGAPIVAEHGVTLGDAALPHGAAFYRGPGHPGAPSRAPAATQPKVEDATWESPVQRKVVGQ